jgi:hypothetical protein
VKHQGWHPGSPAVTSLLMLSMSPVSCYPKQFPSHPPAHLPIQLLRGFIRVFTQAFHCHANNYKAAING